MLFVYHNGAYYPSNEPSLMASNRGFHYGDGFFETIRIYNGQPLYLSHHFSRVLDTLKVYKIEHSPDFTLEKLRSEILGLCVKNNMHEGGSVRITFTRKGAGKYLPKEHGLDYLIEATPLDFNSFRLNDMGMKVDIYPDMKKDVNFLSIYKNINSSIYVMGAIYAQENNLDDALIQNYRGSIIETTNANIFLVSNGVLYTSSLEDGPVAGIMRMQVINLALENNIKVYECPLTPQNLLAADELFVTNAISGIKWVGSYRTKRYFNKMSAELIGLLNTSAENAVTV